MESIVEDVEEKRENEGNPANYQCYIDSGGRDRMRISLRVYHCDELLTQGLFQGHHCQTEQQMKIKFT